MLDNVNVDNLDSERTKKPAKKLLLTPGLDKYKSPNNDLEKHQKQITGIVQKKLAFTNATNDFVMSDKIKSGRSPNAASTQM